MIRNLEMHVHNTDKESFL